MADDLGLFPVIDLEIEVGLSRGGVVTPVIKEVLRLRGLFALHLIEEQL